MIQDDSISLCNGFRAIFLCIKQPGRRDASKILLVSECEINSEVVD